MLDPRTLQILTKVFSRGGVIDRQELHDARGAIEESERLKWLPRLTGELIPGHDKTAKEYVPGIPRRGQISPLPHVSKSETWEFSAHPHAAEKAGYHIDMRLGNPESGIAHSYVVPEGKMPEPGKAVRVIPTYDHTIQYMDFSGEISEGYGKGTVHQGRRTKAEVHHADPTTGDGTKLRFNLYDSNHPQEYSIRKDRDTWWLHNKTLTRERRPNIPDSKPSYKELELHEINTGLEHEVLMPKLDGAHTIVQLESGKIPRVFSYRVGKASETGLIEHTHKIPGLMGLKVPKELDGTVLRAETIATTEHGKAIPAEQIGGMLNSKVFESRKAQESRGASLKTFPFFVERFRGRDASSYPFAEQRKILAKVVEHLPIFTLPDLAQTAEEKRKLIDDVREGRHPLTGEGVVLVNPGQVPPLFTKAKHAPDFDVYVRKIHAAKKEGGDLHDRAGAVSYSWTPDGPIVGQLAGFKHEEARDMLKNPDKYIGRVAKVRAMKKFEAGSGALFQPRFKEWHLDKGDIEKQAMQRGFFDELERIKKAGMVGSGLRNVLGKMPGLGKAMGHRLAEPALDVAGLGMLAAPVAHKMMSEKGTDKAMSGVELGGLGVLAAHPTYEIGKHLLARR